MNEDEALIREIVGRPGEDTPRLVYADWLDERGDLRGPYVRAEEKWATAGRNRPRLGDNPELRELAAKSDLDPVWVARISRPLVGVCCEHVRFIEVGRCEPVTETALQETEQNLGLTLPAAYKAFMLNYNGGRPGTIGSAVDENEVGEPVECFDPLALVKAPNDHPLKQWLRDLPEHPRLRDCIPIGTAADEDDVIYLRCTGKNCGRVYVRHEYKRGDLDPDLVELLSRTFEALLSRIRVRRRY